MANTNGEDLLNKNLSKPLIRTMEDDLKVLKSNPASRRPLAAAEPAKVPPQNLPVSAPPALPNLGGPASKYQPKPPAYHPVQEPPKAKPIEAYVPPSLPVSAPAKAEPEAKTKPEFLATMVGVPAEPSVDKDETPLNLGIASRSKFAAPKPKPQSSPFAPKAPVPSEEPESEPALKTPEPPVKKEAQPFAAPQPPKEEPRPFIAPKPFTAPQPPQSQLAPEVQAPTFPPKLSVEKPAVQKSVQESVSLNPFERKPASPSLNKPFSPKPKMGGPASSSLGKQAKKPAYNSLDYEYAHLTPEMRLARQGASSFSVDLEMGMIKDADMVRKPVSSLKGNLPPVARPSLQKVGSAEYAMPTNPGSALMNSAAAAASQAGSGIVSAIKTLLKYLILLALLAGIGFGVYLFYKSRNNSGATPTATPAQTALVPGTGQFEVRVSFSQDAIPGIMTYVKNNSEKTVGVSRLIVKDLYGSKTLTMDDFDKTLKINIPADFRKNLTGNYELISFNYPQNNYLRLGLVMKVDDVGIVSSMSEQWEPAMLNDFQPLFSSLSGFSSESSSRFGSNIYKGVVIKYLPLGKNDMALNYAIDKKNNLFLVATTKNDIYYLIDAIERQ